MTVNDQTDFYEDRKWLEPAGDITPAFWISKFRIYPDLVEPESKPIREIDLKPGLNIIWSPPAGDQDDESQKGRGHAAGKSSFCRALRYLLGEKTYGNRFIEERLLASGELSSAYLAAEVWIGETVWSVFRPINKRRKDFALRGVSIEEARAIPSAERLDFSDFTDALTDATVARWPVNHFDSGQSDPITWLHLLESLSRDQEAHLSGVHKWRDTSSASEPKDTSDASRAFLVRCLLGLADSKEPKILAERATHLEAIKAADTTITTYTRVFNDSVSTLKKALPDLPHDIKPEDEIFLTVVNEVIERKTKADEKTIRQQIAELKIDELEEKLRDSNQQADTLTGRIAERQEALQSLRDKRESYLENDKPTKKDEDDLCEHILRTVKHGDKTCGVPMEKAMAECQLFWRCGADKLKQPAEPNVVAQVNLSALQQLDAGIATLVQELKPSERIIAAARAEASRLHTLITKNRKTRDTLIQEIANLPLNASGHLGTAERLQDAIIRQHEARTIISAANVDKNNLEDQLRAIRERNVSHQGERSLIFDQIIKRLVHDGLSGELAFTAVEIRAVLRRNGILESEAFKALRCLAYDFTGLIAALNGVGHHPRFILHDSPRESDMESSLYRPIFELIAELETRQPESFQYIVTTTEPPPPALTSGKYVRAKLSSANAKDRLYGSNL
jgi:hypothetical protein